MFHHFADRLIAAVVERKTPLVVGVDPRVDQLPDVLAVQEGDDDSVIAEKVTEFSLGLIDAVADLVPAVKPQAAFFEMLGSNGSQALARVVDYAQSKGLLVIMDAKRGDIGSTAQAYASAYLGQRPDSKWGCDGLTVNPYMGNDTLTPFVDRAHDTGCGLFVLVKTSNPGSDWIQGRPAGGDQSVCCLVADEVQRLSAANVGQSGYGSIGAVVGATYPQQLSELRQRMPNVLFLIPGFGAQGGTAQDVAAGFDRNGLGAVINSSRGIIFAYEKPAYANRRWQDAVRLAAQDTIDRIADGTSAAALRD